MHQLYYGSTILGLGLRLNEIGVIEYSTLLIGRLEEGGEHKKDNDDGIKHISTMSPTRSPSPYKERSDTVDALAIQVQAKLAMHDKDNVNLCNTGESSKDQLPQVIVVIPTF